MVVAIRPSINSVQIGDILRLARSDLQDASSQLDQIYQWRYDHKATVAKAIVGLGASIAVAAVAAVFQHGAHSSWVPVYAAGGAALVFLVIGGVVYVRLNAIYREYIAAHELLATAIQVRPFLKLYEMVP